MWRQMMEYLQHNTSAYLLSIWQHLGISVASLLIATAIAVPAGVLCVRHGRTQKLIVPLFQVLRVVPSLAVLLLLLPVLGTGVRPAMAALVLLAIPPILMNTVAGLEEVPAFLLETAVGCGMTSRQVWWKVRFPLAMPMLLTGVKTAMIEIIASATLAAKIGAGGLGEIIFTGLGLNRFDLLLIGGVTVAALTVAVSLLLQLLDRAALRYKHIC